MTRDERRHWQREPDTWRQGLRSSMLGRDGLLLGQDIRAGWEESGG
jgi:hypothetical protein